MSASDQVPARQTTDNIDGNPNFNQGGEPFDGAASSSVAQAGNLIDDFDIDTDELDLNLFDNDLFEEDEGGQSESERPAEVQPTDTQNAGRKRKTYQRHTPEQIHVMETFLKECPHPDEKQRKELARKLNLSPMQVKFWFQNKRTQIKFQHERQESSQLRAENERLREENVELKRVFPDCSCSKCGNTLGTAGTRLVSENKHLKEKVYKQQSRDEIPIDHVRISAGCFPEQVPDPLLNQNPVVELGSQQQHINLIIPAPPPAPDNNIDNININNSNIINASHSNIINASHSSIINSSHGNIINASHGNIINASHSSMNNINGSCSNINFSQNNINNINNNIISGHNNIINIDNINNSIISSHSNINNIISSHNNIINIDDINNNVIGSPSNINNLISCHNNIINIDDTNNNIIGSHSNINNLISCHNNIINIDDTNNNIIGSHNNINNIDNINNNIIGNHSNINNINGSCSNINNINFSHNNINNIDNINSSIIGSHSNINYINGSHNNISNINGSLNNVNNIYSSYNSINDNVNGSHSNINNDIHDNRYLKNCFRILKSVTDLDRSLITQLAASALEEVSFMARVGEPIWVPNIQHTAIVLDDQEYFKTVQTQGIFVPKKFGYKPEASREFTAVLLNPQNIIMSFMELNKWLSVFSGIVAKGLVVDVISPGEGLYDGRIQLMSAEFKILSPVAPARDCLFARYCKQINEGTWAVVDVSVDAVFPKAPAAKCHKRPSGCIIRALPNDCTEIIWVEHVEVQEEMNGSISNPVLNLGELYGAKRWISILKRQCERLGCAMGRADFQYYENLKDIVLHSEVKQNLRKLAERMVLGYCGGVCASGGSLWTTVSGNGIDEVRIMTRNNIRNMGTPPGLTVSASICCWFPTLPRIVFDYLRNHKNRSEWDILSVGGYVDEVLYMGTGPEDGNCVSIIQVNGPRTDQESVFIFQESSCEPTTSFIVFAPMDVTAAKALFGGGDPETIQLLPSGFTIIPSAPPIGHPAAAAAICDDEFHNGTLLSISFQILVESNPLSSLSANSVANVNNLMESTMNNIKTALAPFYL